MRIKLLLAIAAVSTAAAVIACGSADSSSGFDGTPSNAGDPTGGGGTGGGVEGGKLNGNDEAGAAPTPAAAAGSVVLVHASRNLPAFRVCFEGHTNTLPLPDDKIMPNANVVGVDVGTAVHIGQLDDPPKPSNPDASVPVYDAGEAGADAGPIPTGELHVIEEKLARQFFPQNTDAAAWPNCGDLVTVLQQNGYEGHGLYSLTGNTLSPSKYFANFVVVTGCLPDPMLTTKECGAGFTTAKGNLAYQTLQVTAQDDMGFDFEGVTASPSVANGSTLLFHPASNGAASAPLTLTSMAVSSATSSTLPDNDADYANAKFEIQGPGGATLLTTSLADIQARSAARELPAAFFGLRSTFVLFAIGDSKVNLTDPTAPTALHLLAVPVQDPAKIDPDGGAL